jgi:hypothetical protein
MSQSQGDLPNGSLVYAKLDGFFYGAIIIQGGKI